MSIFKQQKPSNGKWLIYAKHRLHPNGLSSVPAIAIWTDPQDWFGLMLCQYQPQKSEIVGRARSIAEGKAAELSGKQSTPI